MIQLIIQGLWKLPWKILQFIDLVCHIITAIFVVTYGILTGAPSATEGGGRQSKRRKRRSKK